MHCRPSFWYVPGVSEVLPSDCAETPDRFWRVYLAMWFEELVRRGRKQSCSGHRNVRQRSHCFCGQEAERLQLMLSFLLLLFSLRPSPMLPLTLRVCFPQPASPDAGRYVFWAIPSPVAVTTKMNHRTGEGTGAGTSPGSVKGWAFTSALSETPHVASLILPSFTLKIEAVFFLFLSLSRNFLGYHILVYNYFHQSDLFTSKLF